MSRFWQLFRPALARKAGQLNPQTLVGSLVARHGTSRSKSCKQFSLSAMTLRTQAASVCDNTCSVSTQQHSRSEHIVISQGNAVMFCQGIVLFRENDNNCITHAAAAPSNLDAAITMRSAETELQNTIELRATASEIAAPKPDLDAKATKRRFWSTFEKEFYKENCYRQKWENLLTNHCRSLDAATPILNVKSHSSICP